MANNLSPTDTATSIASSHQSPIRSSTPTGSFSPSLSSTRHAASCEGIAGRWKTLPIGPFSTAHEGQKALQSYAHSMDYVLIIRSINPPKSKDPAAITSIYMCCDRCKKRRKKIASTSPKKQRNRFDKSTECKFTAKVFLDRVNSCYRAVVTDKEQEQHNHPYDQESLVGNAEYRRQYQLLNSL